MKPVVEAGHWVILCMADGKQHLVQACSGKTHRLGKHWIKLDHLIGSSYGSIFEVKGKGELSAIQSNELFEDIAIPDFEGGDALEPGETDNRDFNDTNTAQKLTADDVRQLKEGGASGQELLQALVQGSDTWEKKTAFAKQKWATKKLAKHVVRLRVVRCDSRTLSECLFLKNTGKGAPTIRSDALAQVLSYSNVHAGAQVLVCESLGGLVLASVLERLGGHGRLLHLHGTQQPTFEAVRYLNLGPSGSTGVLCHIPTSQLVEIESEQEPPPPTLDDAAIDPSSLSGGAPLDPKSLEEMRERKFARLRSRHQERMTQRELMRQGVDSIILASRYDPTKLLTRLLPFLNPSCPFVIFSECREPLVECFNHLQEHESGTTTKLQLSTTWLRDYQVKPGRSHPNMTMSADGGYLLTGLKLVTAPEDASAARAGQEGSATKRQKTQR